MRKLFQFVVFFLQTFVRRHKNQIFIAAVAGFFLTLFFIHAYPLYVQIFGRRSQKIGIVGRFTETSLPIFIQNQISPGLTSISSTGEATAAAATAWEVDKDGTHYIFHLKPNLSWHDGKNFISSDINYKLRDVIFEYPDKNTLKVVLKEAYAPLPVLLSKPLLKQNLVGLGPYKVARLSRSEGFISELTLSPYDKDLAIISYKFYPNATDAILAFKLGEINVLQDLSDASDLGKWKNVLTREVIMYDRFVGIFFNLKNSFFKEKEVRQALIYALPAEPSWQKVFTPISPQSWAYSAKIRLYNYDAPAAEKILAKAPIASSAAEVVLSTFPALLPTAEKVADAWKRVGINAKIKVENSIPDDFQMFLMTAAIPTDPDQYQYWQSTQEATNIGSYANPKIDKLLEDGRRTMDMEMRKKIYADFQRYLVDDAPVIFLYYPEAYTVERK